MDTRGEPGCRVWIDGAARGNPGEAAFGIFVRHATERDEFGGYLGHATNNVAEYTALIAALAYAEHRGIDHLTVFSDSQLLVRQVNGEYRVKAPNLRPLFFKVLELRRSLRDFSIKHVRREDNRDADRIANEAIDERRPLPGWLSAELPTIIQ
ncbi:MAG: ribonuclease HI family protein [Acidobacteriota bacterium]|nr:ribonuclease HI family protein [Acidobacteriota bacterium]